MRWSWALVALVLAIGGALARPPRTAFACSGGASVEETFRLSDVVIEGTFTSWEALPGSPPGNQLVSVRVTMDVTRTYKGAPSATIAMVDPVSLHQVPDGVRWVGAAGACGAFDFDPTGHHAIMGLQRQDDGTLRPNRLAIFYFDGYSTAASYDGVVAALQRLAGPRSPESGTGLAAGDGGAWPPVLMLVLFAGGGLLAAGILLLGLTREREPSPRRGRRE